MTPTTSTGVCDVLDRCTQIARFAEWASPVMLRNRPAPVDSGEAAIDGMCFLAHKLGDPSHHGARIWVSAPMVDLCWAAEKSLPSFAITSDDLPWDHATVVLEKPIIFGAGFVVPDESRSRTCALQWVTAAGAITVLGWTPDTPMPEFGLSLCPVSTFVMPFGAGNDSVGEMVDLGLDGEVVELSPGARRHMRFMYVLWSMLRDRIAVTERQRSPRAGFRRWERRYGPPDDLVVITLRRPSGHCGDQSDPTFVDWSHQWIVDGHWRNQWYPSLNAHRPKWISPYVKGPEGKPLVVKEKVYAWTR